MVFKLLATLQILLVMIKGTPSPPPSLPPKHECFKLLKDFRATDEFGANVGHAIHSINVRALQKFEPSTTENNSVPTINLNLSSDKAVLPYAPDRRGPSDGKFLSEGMKTLDEVLSRMDDKTFDIKFFSTLEKVAHVFHMEEAWAMVHHEYEKLKSTNLPKSDVCECVMDIENNGVLKMLRFTALAIREPQLIYGNNMKVYKQDVNQKGYYIPYPVYTYHFKLQKAFREKNKDLKPDQILMEENQSMPRLVDSAAWEKWKRIGDMGMEEHFDTALFLYCALKN